MKIMMLLKCWLEWLMLKDLNFPDVVEFSVCKFAVG